VLAGVAVAALAAASVTAVVRYRLGHRPGPDARAGLDELAARLDGAGGSAGTTPNAGLGRLLETLQRTQGLTKHRLRHWIAGLRAGSLTPEQATVAESELGILEREADQIGL
jgi:hypothetical protein